MNCTLKKNPPDVRFQPFSNFSNLVFMKKTALLSLLFMGLLPFALLAQKGKPAKKKDDKKKDNIEIIEIKEDEDDNDYFERKKESQELNILKINPFAAIGGVFPIYFERVLGPHFSVEVAAGPTLHTNAQLLAEILSENGDFDENLVYQKKIGFVGKIGFRYYPSKRDLAPDGFYMSGELQYQNFKRTTFGYDSFGGAASSGTVYDVKLKKTDFVRVIAGWTSVYDNFVSEYFVGFGLRQKDIDRLDYSYDGQTGTYTNLPTSSSEILPAFLLGWKIGFSF